MTPKGHTRRRSLRDSAVFQLHKVFGKSSGKTVITARQWLSSLGPRSQQYDPRIIPQLIDRIAERHPTKVWASWPKTSDPKDGFAEVTWRELASAINRAATWLEKELQEQPEKQVIAFLATTKRVSIVMMVAAAKTGNKLMFLSPRNSLEGQLSLIDRLKIACLMTPETQLPQVKDVKEARPHLKHLVVPDIDFFLEGPEPKSRPFKGTFDQLRFKTFWYVHSSGTTSLPKPVGFSFGAGHGTHLEMTHDYTDGQSVWQKTFAASDKFMCGFPLFHLAGSFFTLVLSAITGVEVVLPPEDVPLNGSTVARLCTSSKAPFIAFLPPAVIEDVYKDPMAYKALVKQPLMITGGASLPQKVGDDLVRDGLTVINALASSETSILPLLAPDQSDWNSFHFPKVPCMELESLGDGRYELVLHKVWGKWCPSVFSNFPELTEYRTNDIFTRHLDPTKQHLWVVAGRADDVIVLLTGEKFTPSALEEDLQTHRDIVTALVFGMKREQAALLLEPKDPEVLESAERRQSFVNSIWPAVEMANTRIPQHGRIIKSYIMLVNPAKGVLRTPKGSVQRAKMYDLYKEETNILYGGRRTSEASSDGALKVADDDESTSMKHLKQIICTTANRRLEDLGDDDNIFMSGFDSLHATQLVKELEIQQKTSIEVSMVYNNPTVRDLHAAIYGSDMLGWRKSSTTGDDFKATDIISTIDHLTKDLPRSPTPSSGKVALLTGTSGGLGQHLLHIARQRYSHVYVFVRSPVTPEQNEVKGVTYLHADLAAPQLGLAKADWLMLLQSVTHILHNAWLVDFNHPLARFTVMIIGVRGLIDFALESRHSPRLWFASSIGAVQGMPSEDNGRVLERIYPVNNTSDKTAVGGMGYAQSKRASELLLARAGEVSGLRSSICRIGQIAGTSTTNHRDPDGRILASWQERDYMPTLLKSARYLKTIPREIGWIGRLDWTPIDHVARIIFELVEAGDAPDADVTQVFHLTNPALRRPEWSDMLPTVRRHLAGKDENPEDIKIVDTMAEWVERLEKSAEGATRKEVEKNPGIKLLQFFKDTADGRRDMPVLDTSKAQAASETLRQEPAMNAEWMESWMKEWFPED